MRKFLFLLLFVSACGVGNLHAQRVAVKTNLLYDATATVNLGAEFGLAPKWTLDISGNYNGWSFSDYRKWKHYLIQPEARYWLCERFNGHFFGLHAHGGEFNVSKVHLPFGLFPGARDARHEGYYYGAGIAYGYHWILGKRWSIEAEIGVGYVGSDYKTYECVRCGEYKGTFHKNYFGPTKAAVSIIFMIK